MTLIGGAIEERAASGCERRGSGDGGQEEESHGGAVAGTERCVSGILLQDSDWFESLEGFLCLVAGLERCVIGCDLGIWNMTSRKSCGAAMNC